VDPGSGGRLNALATAGWSKKWSSPKSYQQTPCVMRSISRSSESRAAAGSARTAPRVRDNRDPSMEKWMQVSFTEWHSVMTLLSMWPHERRLTIGAQSSRMPGTR
jgi:hypothetical protein